MAKKNKIVSIRVTEGFNSKLQRLARKDGRTKADWIRRRITAEAKSA
jgi:predicted DNA-binding protein